MKERNEIAIQDAAITEVKEERLFDDGEAIKALFGGFTRLLEFQEEYYRRHPLRRLLRNMKLLPDPDVKARMWALEQLEMEDRADERT